jgi:transcriptional regulator with XRE-family HTH domain
MEEKGLKKADLARRTGLSAPSIWALVHGVTKMPKASTLVQVAAALGVPLKAILKTPAGRQDQAELREEMLAAFDALTPENQQAIVAAASSLVGKPKPPKRR